MKSILFLLLAAVAQLISMPAGAQTHKERPPIIDMHMHASAPDSQGPPPLAICTPISPMPAWDPRAPYAATFMDMLKHPRCANPVWSAATDEDMLKRTLAVMEKYNVIGVVNSDSDELAAAWRKGAPARIIPAMRPGIVNDVLKVDAATVERVKAAKAAGNLDVLSEVGTQYDGVAPDDARLEPFWKMAEELDIPVGIHLGTGPPGTPYLADSLKGYRARLHSPLTIEDVLIRHPKLRVYLMHAGYPMLDDLLAVLYTHPQVHVDVGVIVYTQPRAAFYRYLQAIVDAGFGNRVMFGSDNMVWPETIERSIRVIEEAPFLNAQQKRAILYDNAARFLRLNEEQMRKHRSM